MIFGNIQNLKEYAFLENAVKECFDYAGSHDLKAYEKGSHEIDGKRLFVNIVEYQTVEAEKRFWEAHREYLDIQARLTKKELSFETQTKIGQYVSLIVGIFSIIVSMVLANGGVKSAYEWFNGFMGLVLGILIGTFILGAFTKVANTFGATLAFIAASAVMVGIKYFAPAGSVSIWSYSLISIAVSLAVGIPASIISRKMTGDTSVPAPNTTVFK